MCADSSPVSFSLPSTEEVADRHQPGGGRVALRGGGELLGEAVLPAAAGVRPDLQQPLDVLQAAVQGLQASPGLRQHPQTGGEGGREGGREDTQQLVQSGPEIKPEISSFAQQLLLFPGRASPGMRGIKMEDVLDVLVCLVIHRSHPVCTQ